MFDIKFYEVFKEEEFLLKELLPTQISTSFTQHTIQQDKDEKAPARLISIRTQSSIPTAWAKDLDGILTRSQGSNHVVKYIKKTKFSVQGGFLGDYCSSAVAEQAILLMLMLIRKIKAQMRQFKTFCRDDITGNEVARKKVLIVGVGNIGKEIAKRLKAFGADIRGVDIKPNFMDIKYVSLRNGLKWADVIFCALPLTEKTNKLLNKELLTCCKHAPIIINISRGEVTPISDMKMLIEKEVLGGLAMDVFDEEQILADDLRLKNNTTRTKNIQTMKEKDNVIFTPHNAFNTHEAVKRKAELTVQAIVQFLKEKKFPHPISI